MSLQTVYPVTLIFFITLRCIFFEKEEVCIAEDYKNDERKV